MNRLVLVGLLALAACATQVPGPAFTGSVVSVVSAKSYDSHRNVASEVTSSFSPTDRQIVLGVTLQGYPAGSRCEFVRYLNGKYLDHGSVPVKKPTANTVFFTWTLTKPGVSHLPGPYRIKVFVNGRYARELTYFVG